MKVELYVCDICGEKFEKDGFVRTVKFSYQKEQKGVFIVNEGIAIKNITVTIHLCEECDESDYDKNTAKHSLSLLMKISRFNLN